MLVVKLIKSHPPSFVIQQQWSSESYATLPNSQSILLIVVVKAMFQLRYVQLSISFTLNFVYGRLHFLSSLLIVQLEHSRMFLFVIIIRDQPEKVASCQLVILLSIATPYS